MQAQVGGAIGRQRARRHGRAEIGAADADVHDVAQCVAARAANGAGAHGLGEGRYLGAHVAHFGHYVLSIDQDRPAVEISQRHVQRRAMFGQIDLLACEQRCAPLFHLRGAGQRDEQLHRARVRSVLGKVEQQIVEAQAETLEAPGIFCEKVDRAARCNLAAVCLKSGKGRANVRARHVWSISAGGIESADAIASKGGLRTVRATAGESHLR